VPETLTPTSFEEAAAALADAAAGRHPVRIIGGATKGHWGRPCDAAELELHTTALDRVLEHNAGDLTAVLEAGVPLARAQREFASADQMLAIDPFLGHGHEATIGGILATGDCGPLRHRYGAPRDLILGITVALSDGTVARAGGNVIKNVAGYDLGKLFCGSFGTLGLILSANLRLHPLPAATATTLGVSGDPDRLAAAALALAAEPLELEALDVAWRAGRGGILARSGGTTAAARARRVAERMGGLGLERIDVADPDAELWARQRAGQRSDAAALARVAARPSAWAAVLRAAESAGATLVGRAALGHSYLELDPAALSRLREATCALLDLPPAARAAAEPWGPPPAERLAELMRSVKARFDPARVCNPGVFVAGI
jgi:glycolate oxidase FAD binding subunit